MIIPTIYRWDNRLTDEITGLLKVKAGNGGFGLASVNYGPLSISVPPAFPDYFCK